MQVGSLSITLIRKWSQSYLKALFTRGASIVAPGGPTTRPSWGGGGSGGPSFSRGACESFFNSVHRATHPTHALPISLPVYSRFSSRLAILLCSHPSLSQDAEKPPGMRSASPEASLSLTLSQSAWVALPRRGSRVQIPFPAPVRLALRSSFQSEFRPTADRFKVTPSRLLTKVSRVRREQENLLLLSEDQSNVQKGQPIMWR